MDSNSAKNPRSPSNEFGPLAASNGSNEKTHRANTTKQRVPIYLRASTGSCHDICKYGKHHSFEDKPRESLRRRISKSSPKNADSIKIIASSDNNNLQEERSKEKAIEPLRTTTTKVKSLNLKDEPSSDYSKKHSFSINTSPRTKSCSPKLLYCSARRSDSLKNKTCLPDLRPAKKYSSLSEVPEIIKREILPSEKDESPVREGKISGADKRTTCDQSSPMKSKLIKVKSVSSSGNPHGFRTGRKMTSSMTSADKVCGTPSSARSPTTRLSLKTSSIKAEKTLRVMKTGTEKNNALNLKTGRGGRVVSAFYPLNHRKDTEKSDDCEKTLHVIKTEIENLASSSSLSSVTLSCAKSTSLSFHEENDDNEEIKDETEAMEKTVSMKIDDVRHSSSHEDDEKIDYSNNEADESISDKIISLEIEYLQPLEIKNRDATPSLSSYDEDDEKICPSSASESSLEEISGAADESVSDKTIHMEINDVDSVKKNRKNLKNSKLIVVDDKKSRLPVKLKFRRGTIIDLQPENNVPKRLRFKRARIGDRNMFSPDSKKSTETYKIKPTISDMALRKANSFIFENKPGTPNKPLRKSRSTVSDDKSRPPLNLIRREKTAVDLHTGNKSPTRLKFSRGRVLRAEDGKSDLRRKAIKKAGKKNDTFGFELSSGKVVLKHPEVQSRKKGQVLLNNVIEETASKLVESRKSKVKALVGAFETVISLQEMKPSSR